MNPRDDQYVDLFGDDLETEMGVFLGALGRAYDTELPLEGQRSIGRRLKEQSLDELAILQTKVTRNAGVGRRVVTMALACAFAAIGGLSVAATSSASVRHALVQAIPPLGLPGVTMAHDGRPVSIRPGPSFEVYYPSSLPVDLPIVGSGQLPNSGLTVGLNCVEEAQICQQTDTKLLDLFPPPATGPSDWPATIEPLAQRGIPVVWVGRHAIPPDQRSIQIVEWSVNAKSISEQPNTIIGGNPATVDRSGSETIITLKRGTTAIQITTNLGATSAESIAASLESSNVGTNQSASSSR